MPISQLLFSFRGRINRKPWWLAGLVVGLIAVVILILAFVMAGGALLSQDPGAILAALGAAMIVLALVYIPLVWIGLALGAKRLHDRNKSAWWLLIFWILPLVLQGFGAQVEGAIGMILNLAGFGLSIWGLIELGFLRGTVGPNQYGPDPLEGQA